MMQEKFTLVMTADSVAMITGVKQAEAALGGLNSAANEASASLGRMPQAAAGMGKVDQSLKQVGMSAAATSAALRNVPAQFTDIVVSLQSGQSPLTVLMQQGGQLKDMFGGIGPAARALGGYVAGLVTPVTAVAGSLAVLAAAYYKGSQEADRMRQSLLMTGNAAGTSAGQLQAMAAAMGNGFGQAVGQSAEALTAMASTGQVASGNLRAFAQTAIDMEKSFGQSLDATAKHFAELGKDPVGASARLNASLNYLTTTTYEQIRTAKALGDEERAASIAQDAYAQAMKARTAVVVENLGYMERGWRAVATGAKEAWDAIADVGRRTSSSEQLAKFQEELVQREASVATGRNVAYHASRVAFLKEQINLLGETERMLKRGNEAQAQRAALEKAGIAATDAVAKANERAATKQEQLNKALKEYRDNLATIRAANPNSAALDPAQVAKTEAAIRDQFKTAPGTGGAGSSEAERQARAYLELTQNIRAKIDAQALELAQGSAVTAAQKQQVELERLVATGKIAAKDASSEKTQALLREFSASEEMLRLDREEIKANEEAEKRYAASLSTQQKSLDTLDAEIAKQQQANEAIGLGAVAVAALEVAKLREQATSKDRLATVMDEIDWSGKLGESYRLEAARLRQLATLKEQGAAKTAVIEEAKAATAEWTKFTDQVNQSLTDSLMRAFESGGNFFKTFWRNVVNTFKTSVLKAIIQPVVGGLTGALGLGGSAMAGQAASALGSSGGLLGSLSNLSSLYSAATAGYTAMMGAGVTALLGTAAGNAAIATALTGSASSAAAAATAAAQAAGTATAATGTLAGLGAGIATAMPWVIGGLAVAGLAKKAFGRGPKVSQAQGIEGTFTTDGASLRGFEDWSQKGGWFRSGKSGTNYSSLDKGTSDFFSDSLRQITAATKAYASILGLNADAINGITQSVRINLKGLDAAGREKAIAGALGGFGDKLAEQLLGTFETYQVRVAKGWAMLASQGEGEGGRIERLYGMETRTRWTPGEFVREGETAGVALQRLATSLVSVNTVFDTLNVTLMRGSLIGADASSKLLDLFGGAEKLTQSATAYFNTYYTAAERSRIATRQLTDVFKGMGRTLPGSRDELRALIEQQDLYTDAGRATYAALVQLAPAFDEVTRAAEQAAAEVAGKLIASLTGNRGMVPAMVVAAGALAKASRSAAQFTGPVSTINRLLGDASSGTLTFGDRLATTTAALDPAQAAVQLLQGEVFALQTAASGTVVNIAGLQAALDGVDTRTFVATVTGVFELIGQRVKDVLSGIASERVAVRDAAMSIIGAGAMSPAQIAALVRGSVVGMPGNDGIMRAQSQVAAADAFKGQRTAAMESANRQLYQQIDAQQRWINQLQADIGVQAGWRSAIEADLLDLSDNKNTSEKWRLIGLQQGNLATANQNIARMNQQTADAQAAISAYTRAIENNRNSSAAEIAAAQTAAAKAAVQAQLDYVASLQKYSLDASKAVTQLGRLREETVNYYNTQKALADNMSSAATSLRGTIAAFRFDQLDPRAQLASLQERYNVAYSMALSTTGDALAGYGNELNSLINPLLQKAQEAGLGGTEYSALVNTVLARAEATANRLDAFAPKDYQAESLGLLGQIDSTLAALEAGALTADQLIVSAINAGKDTTRDGLRAVLAALTGQTVPAFAMGGLHAGGLRLVGENGPELEDTGPSRIFSAAQTRSMFSGNGNAELVNEVRSLKEQVKELTRVAIATAGHTANTAENTRSMDKNGVLIYTATGQPVEVTPA